MKESKVLLMTRVTTVWSKLDEFNEYWGRTNLPFWTENGARHIGSYTNYLGGKKAEIIRLFEFESLSAWNRFMEIREAMFKSEEAKRSLPDHPEFFEGHRRIGLVVGLLIPLASPSPPDRIRLTNFGVQC